MPVQLTDSQSCTQAHSCLPDRSRLPVQVKQRSLQTVKTIHVQKSTSCILWIFRCIVYCGFGVTKRLSVYAASETAKIPGSRNQNKLQLSMHTSLEQPTAKDLRCIVLLQCMRRTVWLPAFQFRLQTPLPGIICGKPCSRSNSTLCQKFKSACTSWLHRAQAQKCRMYSRKEFLSVLDAKLCWRIFCITGLLQKRIWLTLAYKHHSGKLYRGDVRALILHIESCAVTHAISGETVNISQCVCHLVESEMVHQT